MFCKPAVRRRFQNPLKDKKRQSLFKKHILGILEGINHTKIDFS